jgi:SNF2 family DNA or RNA helicase
MIVHNCGVAYDGDRNEVTLDASHRLAETLSIVEEASTKVIIYVPFVSSIKLVTEHLRSHGQQVESVHGGTSKSERDRIFRAFQKDAEPRVLVAQPAAMSHGLTLTAASTILWYAPITSNDIFEQANGRITRPSQKNNQFIIMLEGAPVERKIYDRLRNKQKVQGVLLSMIQTNR